MNRKQRGVIYFSLDKINAAVKTISVMKENHYDFSGVKNSQEAMEKLLKQVVLIKKEAKYYKHLLFKVYGEITPYEDCSFLGRAWRYWLFIRYIVTSLYYFFTFRIKRSFRALVDMPTQWAFEAKKGIVQIELKMEGIDAV